MILCLYKQYFIKIQNVNKFFSNPSINKTKTKNKQKTRGIFLLICLVLFLFLFQVEQERGIKSVAQWEVHKWFSTMVKNNFGVVSTQVLQIDLGNIINLIGLIGQIQ